MCLTLERGRSRVNGRARARVSVRLVINRNHKFSPYREAKAGPYLGLTSVVQLFATIARFPPDNRVLENVQIPARDKLRTATANRW